MPREGLPPLARLISLPEHMDARGRLTELDFTQLPFVPVRAFYVSQASPGTVRGRHAHATGSQLLVCVSGEVEVELRHGGRRETVTLKNDSTGLLIETGVWAQQHYRDAWSVLLVFSSIPFAAETYRDEQGRPIDRTTDQKN